MKGLRCLSFTLADQLPRCPWWLYSPVSNIRSGLRLACGDEISSIAVQVLGGASVTLVLR